MKDFNPELKNLCLNFINKLINDSEKYNWSKEKRINYKLFFRTPKQLIESINSAKDLNEIYENINVSFKREIYNVIPQVDRLIGDKYDRFYSVSGDSLKSLVQSNLLFNNVYNNDLTFDIASKIGIELNSIFIENKKQLEHFNYDYEKMMDDVKVVYYSDHSLIHYLIKFKLEFIENNFDYWLDVLLTHSPWKGATPIQVLRQLGLKYLEGLQDDVIIQPFTYLLIGNNQVQVSKKTANKFVVNVINIINKQLQLRETKIITVPNKFVDSRIRVGALKDDIKNYFYQLLTVKGLKTNRENISVQSLDKFLGHNFQEFELDFFEDKIDLDIKKGHLRYFIFCFYQNFDNVKSRNKLRAYVDLLINNFKAFENDNANSLYKHMSRVPPKDYPFEI